MEIQHSQKHSIQNADAVSFLVRVTHIVLILGALDVVAISTS